MDTFILPDDIVVLGHLLGLGLRLLLAPEEAHPWRGASAALVGEPKARAALVGEPRGSPSLAPRRPASGGRRVVWRSKGLPALVLEAARAVLGRRPLQRSPEVKPSVDVR